MEIDLTKLISGKFSAVKELDETDGANFLESVRTNFIEVQAQKENLTKDKEALTAENTTLKETIAAQENTLSTNKTVIERLHNELAEYESIKQEQAEAVRQDMVAKVKEQIQGLGLNTNEELSVSLLEKSTDELTAMLATFEGLKIDEELLRSRPPIGNTTTTKPDEGGHHPGEGKKDFMRKIRK